MCGSIPLSLLRHEVDLTAWIQVLGFTEEPMPPDKVPSGVLVTAVLRLSGSVSNAIIGCGVLVQKGGRSRDNNVQRIRGASSFTSHLARAA